MFRTPTLRIPRPPNSLVLGILLVFFFGFTLASAASAYVDKTVRWSKSPLKNSLGQPLPPATSYEVWVLKEGGVESMAATVPDTTWTLRALPGVTYYVRVRGVSALGLKSAFSPSSDPYRSPEVSATPPELLAGLGAAYPNPFNARTTIAYVVPDGLTAAAPVALEIFDVRGRRLRVLDLDRSPGSHEVLWDGRADSGLPVPAGMYIARYVCGSFSAGTKLTLVP